MKKLVGMLLVVALVGVALGKTPVWYGDWALTSIVDAFTDEENGVIMAQPAEQPSVLRTMGLVVMCESGLPGGVLVVVADHPEFLFGSTTSVTYRVDSKLAVTSDWAVGQAGVGPFGGSATQFINELVGGQRLLLRLSPGGSPYEFSLFGFDQALDALGCYTGAL